MTWFFVKNLVRIHFVPGPYVFSFIFFVFIYVLDTWVVKTCIINIVKCKVGGKLLFLSCVCLFPQLLNENLIKIIQVHNESFEPLLSKAKAYKQLWVLEDIDEHNSMSERKNKLAKWN